MTLNLTFDEIRPYYDHEVNAVLKRISSDPVFEKILKYLYPELSTEEFHNQIQDIHSVQTFQKKFVSTALKRIVSNTTSSLTYDGLENLSTKKNYIFISNHRDIILDSALMNYIIFSQGFNTTEVAVGDNLLISQAVTDIAKLNKNFIVHRNIPTRQLYAYSYRLSSYIYHTLKEKNTSVWIAQKEGRSKNGIDKTQQGVIKMLGIASAENRFSETYKALNIVPVSISYEYEPCDNLKASELYQKSINPQFKKSPTDDKISMISGVTEFKGRVHFAFGKPLSEEIDPLDTIQNKNEQIQNLAQMIDHRIYKNFKLNSVNYIAYDIINSSKKYQSKYSEEDKVAFLNYLEERISKVPGDSVQLTKRMLDIYGNPVMSKEHVNDSV